MNKSTVLVIVMTVISAATICSAKNDNVSARKDAAEARKAKLEAAKANRQNASANAAEAKENWRKKAEEKKAERDARKEELQNKLQESRLGVIDRRETRQEKRIQHGINKGFLTEDEITRLRTQQDSIAALEASLTADGKLTGNEFRQLQQELNEASRSIWSEKHDTDGNQMAVYRLGKNVFANNTLTSALGNENLSKTEAKTLLKDFRRTVELKQMLSGDLTDADRAKLQAEYDDLLNKYFETR